MIITDEIVKAYLQCPYKSCLKFHNSDGDKTDYEVLQNRLDAKFHIDALAKLQADYPQNHISDIPIATTSILQTGKCLITDTTIKINGLQSSFDALIRSSKNSCLYEPVLYCRFPKIISIQKLILGYKALVLGQFQGEVPTYGYVIYGNNFSITKIRLASYISKIEELISDLKKQIIISTNDISPILNAHCDICEYSAVCRTKAAEIDHLSLLRGISEKEILRSNQKGIFTVHQLSYTFRSKKPSKRAKKPSNLHYFALQALALRENKVYIHGTPKLPTAERQVFFDIEGIPERDFYYLIGAIIVDGKRVTHRFFWADSEQEQEAIFRQFVEFIGQASGYRLFHFGSYDSKALKKMKERLPTHLQSNIDIIIDKSVNLLSIIYPHIYFPTYSNRLKDIGQILGFIWTEPNASGIQSIIWRELWEEHFAPDIKEKLIQYNVEDCLALNEIYNFIRHVLSVIEGVETNDEQYPKILETQDLKQPSKKYPIYGNFDFVFQDFGVINKCSYFDYQRERVFVRTRKQPRKTNKYTIQRPNIVRKPNKLIQIQCGCCPKCKSEKIKQLKEIRRTSVDLKFFKGGVKGWVLQYISWHYACLDCQNHFIPHDFPKDLPQFGHSFMSWCIYQHVVRSQIMLQVYHSLSDLFEIYIGTTNVYNFKSVMATYYKSMYESILDSIVKGELIHIDETPVNLRKSKGYVWVLTSIDKVYFFYKNSREAIFLQEMLANFSGVLVSDFYTGYDSLKCPQQKCLIHLMRDINNHLRQFPFDDDLKIIAQPFGKLLRTIIETIDRYGLKKKYLQKHKKDALNFLENISSQTFSSETAQNYQKRFKKNREKLFTFLDYDEVPWNNNNAEHAIKIFAKYREHNNNVITENSLKEYLVLLTVCQTCEYSNTNVLQFLLSKEKTLESLK